MASRDFLGGFGRDGGGQPPAGGAGGPGAGGESDEIELSLGLSLGGCFGADPWLQEEGKRPRLQRSSSIASICSLPATSSSCGVQDAAPAAAPPPDLLRTSSLPAEPDHMEDRLRRRAIRSQRRLEAKRKRLERRNSMNSGRPVPAAGGATGRDEGLEHVVPGSGSPSRPQQACPHAHGATTVCCCRMSMVSHARWRGKRTGGTPCGGEQPGGRSHVVGQRHRRAEQLPCPEGGSRRRKAVGRRGLPRAAAAAAAAHAAVADGEHGRAPEHRGAGHADGVVQGGGPQQRQEDRRVPVQVQERGGGADRVRVPRQLPHAGRVREARRGRRGGAPAAAHRRLPAAVGVLVAPASRSCTSGPRGPAVGASAFRGEGCSAQAEAGKPFEEQKLCGGGGGSR